MKTKKSPDKPQAGLRRFVLVPIPLNKILTLTVSILVGAAGVYFVAASKAASFAVSPEAESGSLSTPNLRNTDSTASGGATVKFTTQSSGGTTVAVGTAAQLTSALAAAKAGDVITLADGTYSGKFSSTKSGTAQAPITITGSRNAILNGGALTSGYTFTLGTKNSTSTVSYWKLNGFTVTGGQKGVIFDNVQHSVIDGLLVQNIGEEGIHLRNNSSDNIIQNTSVTKTGQDTQAYGEGLYVGSAVSNWSTYSQGNADHSNNNQLLNNNISFTGAENIDIKEGTHGGLIKGNQFDGSGMCPMATADCNSADSLIDMKGEGWTIAQNTGSHVHPVWKGGGQEDDGMQVHVISNTGSEGSGNNNTFDANTISDVGGYGFNIQSKATGTVLKCNNTVTSAGKGMSNVTCQQ